LLVIVCRQLRAVHLESTGSLDTGDLVMALLRFSARRRCPTTIWTDNGGSFESGRAEVLDKDQRALMSRLADVDWSVVESKVGIAHWEYSPPYGPEFNGLAESFVKLAKTRMLKDMKPITFTDDGFRTVVELVMESINSRPLTPMKKGAEWIMVTSNRILKAGIHSQSVLVDESKAGLEEIDKLPAKHYKRTVSVAGLFWSRWLTDILPAMTSTPKWHDFVKNLKVGQLVLVISPKTDQRCHWPQGIVHKCIANDDGAVWRVHVRLLTAKGKEHVFLERPIRQIIPLEMMWDDPRLDLSDDDTESVRWPLQTTEVSSPDLPLKFRRRVQKLPPTLELALTTTSARVDQDVERIGALISEEIGPTTRSRRILLEEYEAEKVDRQVLEEAVISSALAKQSLDLEVEESN
jgi:hypothetical protein